MLELENASSVEPSQSSSVPSQTLSSPVGLPGVHESSSEPETQLVLPLDSHTPVPHVVDALLNDSSVEPSQSSSLPSHALSSPVGLPGVHESCSDPDTQLVDPVDAHTPSPHDVELLE